MAEHTLDSTAARRAQGWRSLEVKRAADGAQAPSVDQRWRRLQAGAAGRPVAMGAGVSPLARDGEGGTKRNWQDQARPAAEADALAGVDHGAVPICFTPGTSIATPQGPRPVEELRSGDAVLTRDNGIQPVCWTGARGIAGAELKQQPDLLPILIRKGALGAGLPNRDMRLSPHHRLLVSNDRTLRHFGEREVLVAAKDLLDLPGASIQPVPRLTYVHIMFEQHEVVLSDGTWTESFQPRDRSLGGIEAAQRSALERLFPALNTPQGIAAFQPARRALMAPEAALLAKD